MKGPLFCILLALAGSAGAADETVPMLPVEVLGRAAVTAERNLGRVEYDIKKAAARCRQQGDEKMADAWLTVRRYVVAFREKVILTPRLLALLELITEEEKFAEGYGVVTDFCRTCREQADDIRRYMDNAAGMFTGESDRVLLGKAAGSVDEAAAAFSAFEAAGR